MFDADSFFRAVILQDQKTLRSFFHPNAWVNWICSNERFTVEEYIRANCEYPGEWGGRIEKVLLVPDGVVLAAKVWSKNQTDAYHVASFLQLHEGKIASLEEYWAEDAPAPDWRRQMKIGKPIS